MSTFTAILRQGGRRFAATRQGSPQYTATLGSGAALDATLFVLPAGEGIPSMHAVEARADGKIYKWAGGTTYPAIGVAETGAAPGEVVRVRVGGVAYVGGWGLVPGKTYVALPGGSLVHTLPGGTTNFQEMGVALTPTQLFVQPFFSEIE